MRSLLLALTLASLALSLAACSNASSLCGDRGYEGTSMGARLCAYPEAIVVEGGFDCPPALRYRIDLEGAVICSDMMLDRDELPEDLCLRIMRSCGRPRVDAGARDAALADASTSDAGACPMDITEGGSCTSEGQICGGPCTDECSFCNLWRCNGGTWQRMEAFPAPCFDCGDLRCRQDTEYCQHTTGGAPPGLDVYECVDAPDACGTMPSCACIDEPGGSTCDDSGDGVVIDVLAP